MKNFILIFIFLITFNSYSQQYQRYNVETGKVSYKKETKKEIITKTIVFKDWGAVEYIIETTKEFKGKKKKKLVKEKTTIIKLDKALIYSVDEDDKKILQMKNYGLVLFKNKNLSDEGKRIYKANGGRKVAHETILGYACEVWKLRNTTTVTYKGVPLKTIVSNDVEIATKAQFDITIMDSDMALPDYPIINANPFQDTEDAVDYYSTEEGQQEVADAWENAQNMTWEDWYILHGGDEEFIGLTQEEIKELYNKKIQERINDRVDDRVNDRINQRINNKIRSKPREKNPLRRIPRW